MSHTRSPSQHRPYGLARICHEWQLARSTLYAKHKREQALVQTQKRGPKTRYSDEHQSIQKVLKNSPWNGEGHRKESNTSPTTCTVEGNLKNSPISTHLLSILALHVIRTQKTNP